MSAPLNPSPLRPDPGGSNDVIPDYDVTYGSQLASDDVMWPTDSSPLAGTDFIASLLAGDDVSWATDTALLADNSFYFDPLLCKNATSPDLYLCVNESLRLNASTNGTLASGGEGEELTDVILMAVTSIILGLMILITVIGNVFVIAAILLERNLHSVANYLIVSLAVADLMVACLVMPLGAVYEISKGWIMGPELCDMWTSSDVLCCTASILHLVAIAVDRYWAVTYVDYIHTRNVNRIGGMIVMIWSVALVVSLAPQFGWKDPEYLHRINVQQKCLPSQDIGYQIFATCSTFYVPLLVILCLYWKIFQTARKRIHKRGKQRAPTAPSEAKQHPAPKTKPPLRSFLSKKRFRRIKASKKSSAAEALVSSLVLVEGHSTASVDATFDEEMVENQEVSDHASGETSGQGDSQQQEVATMETTVLTISEGVAKDGGQGQADNTSPEKSSTTNNGSASHQSHMSDMSKVEILKEKEVIVVNNSHKERMLQKKEKKESLEAKRERKAAKTLAIITGAFVVCWLPFFIMALLMPLCESCYINDAMASFFLWLGYFNSTLNPVIYTIFSPEFRMAFKRILCGAKHPRHSRLTGKMR